MLTLATLASMVMSAHAQMGWTLDQCRRHFGQEFLPAEGDNHYFHVGPTGTGKGEHVYIRLDPDGTVGENLLHAGIRRELLALLDADRRLWCSYFDLIFAFSVQLCALVLVLEPIEPTL